MVIAARGIHSKCQGLVYVGDVMPNFLSSRIQEYQSCQRSIQVSKLIVVSLPLKRIPPLRRASPVCCGYFVCYSFGGRICVIGRSRMLTRTKLEGSGRSRPGLIGYCVLSALLSEFLYNLSRRFGMALSCQAAVGGILKDLPQ